MSGLEYENSTKLKLKGMLNQIKRNYVRSCYQKGVSALPQEHYRLL